MPPPERPDAWDPIHSPSAPGLHWTTVNAGEAVQGVQTPLSWSMWADAAEASTRRACYAIGAMTKAESRIPEAVEDRYVRVFYGRCALQCEVLALLGDRMPGTTGPEAVRSVLGHVPGDLTFRPTRSRYPAIAWKLPRTFMAMPSQVPAFADEYEAWRRSRLDAVPTMATAELATLLASARDRVTDGVAFQTTVLFGGVQPLFDALTRLVERTGVGDVAVLSGSGGAEMAVISDIWAASRGRMSIEQVVANHGFHGPTEGELSSRVWREDDTPLRRMVEQYATREDPMHGRLEQDSRRREQARAVLAQVPRPMRPAAGLLLKLAGERIPLRGVAKRSFLGALDVGRACARRLGEQLCVDGKLDDPADVFYLTVNELSGDLPSGVRQLVSLRRERHDEYKLLVLPNDWLGAPTPIVPEAAHLDQGGRGTITGIGVSGGTVEGVVRVVTDPAFTDVEPDEILVAPITDPSWSSVMFISSALVVDVGGALSHAAVVARELEIPCVVNTRDGTSRLKTGDRVRVDGSAGTITVLTRATL